MLFSVLADRWIIAESELEVVFVQRVGEVHVTLERGQDGFTIANFRVLGCEPLAVHGCALLNQRSICCGLFVFLKRRRHFVTLALRAFFNRMLCVEPSGNRYML